MGMIYTPRPRIFRVAFVDLKFLPLGLPRVFEGEGSVLELPKGQIKVVVYRSCVYEVIKALSPPRRLVATKLDFNSFKHRPEQFGVSRFRNSLILIQVIPAVSGLSPFGDSRGYCLWNLLPCDAPVLFAVVMKNQFLNL